MRDYIIETANAFDFVVVVLLTAALAFHLSLFGEGVGGFVK